MVYLLKQLPCYCYESCFIKCGEGQCVAGDLWLDDYGLAFILQGKHKQIWKTHENMHQRCVPRWFSACFHPVLRVFSRVGAKCVWRLERRLWWWKAAAKSGVLCRRGPGTWASCPLSSLRPRRRRPSKDIWHNCFFTHPTSPWITSNLFRSFSAASFLWIRRQDVLSGYK